MEKKCLIIYNPVSGHAINEKVLDEYKRIFEEKGLTAEFVATEYTNHAAETVKKADDYDIVFSIGGDGTLNEVVRGNYARDRRLTICPLPSGTCNDVASMLGYGTNPIHNLNMALDGEVRDLDIGIINDDPFVYVVGMGKFMNIPYETRGVDKKKNGYLAYIKAAVPEIINKLKRYKAEIEVDGERKDGSYSLIMVSNANHIAGIDGFHRDVCLDDGQMEVLLCRASSKGQFIKNFLMYFLGQKTEDIISLKGHSVSIRLLEQPENRWCIDGERYDYDGRTYRISVGERMSFLTPRSGNKKLFKTRNGQICKV